MTIEGYAVMLLKECRLSKQEAALRHANHMDMDMDQVR